MTEYRTILTATLKALETAGQRERNAASMKESRKWQARGQRLHEFTEYLLYLREFDPDYQQ